VHYPQEICAWSKLKILKTWLPSHLYKHLGNPCQVIIKTMLPCAECQNIFLCLAP
jgi:hypothetical protein